MWVQSNKVGITLCSNLPLQVNDCKKKKSQAATLSHSNYGSGKRTLGLRYTLLLIINIIIIIIQFWSGFIPVNGDGWIYPTLTAISSTPTLHLARLKVSSKPTLLLFSFSTCVFLVFFGRPRFLLPFTSNSNAFLKTCPSSLLQILYFCWF